MKIILGGTLLVFITVKRKSKQLKINRLHAVT